MSATQICDALSEQYWKLRKYITEPGGSDGERSKLRQEQEQKLGQALVEFLESQISQVPKRRRAKTMCRVLASFFGGECMAYLGVRIAFSEAVFSSKLKCLKEDS